MSKRPCPIFGHSHRHQLRITESERSQTPVSSHLSRHTNHHLVIIVWIPQVKLHQYTTGGTNNVNHIANLTPHHGDIATLLRLLRKSRQTISDVTHSNRHDGYAAGRGGAAGGWGGAPCLGCKGFQITFSRVVKNMVRKLLT